MTEAATRFLQSRGYTVSVNSPFAGTLVPMRFYQKDARVSSIMIEINRRLYMTADGRRNGDFLQIRAVLQKLLNTLSFAV